MIMSRGKKARPGANRRWAVALLDRATLRDLAILSGATLALYFFGLGNGFVADDESEVLQDPLIRSLVHIPRLFSRGVWFFAGVKADNFYRPLKLIAYSVEYQFFGFQPVYWHLANIFFH